MSLADQLTLARAAAVPLVIALFVWDFDGHNWWATGVFIAAMSTDWFDGRVARWRGHSSSLGSLLDPVADKVLVLSTLIVLIDGGSASSSEVLAAFSSAARTSVRSSDARSRC